MLKRVLPFGLIAVLGAPLIFGKFLLYPFVVYRTYSFFIAVDALFVVFLLVNGLSWRTWVFKNSVMRATGLFLFVKFVTDMVGVAPSTSFWGTYERMFGFVTWLHLFVYLVMIVAMFREQQLYQKLFRWLALVGGAVSLYGILQHYDIAFRIRQVDERVFSTVGNPAFLAGFLLLTLCVGGMALVNEKHRVWRWSVSISMTLSLWTLYLTATRGAIIGFLAVCFFLTVFFFCFSAESRTRYTQRQYRVRLGIFLVIILGAPLLILLFREASLVERSLALRRFATISIRDTSTASRIFLWRSALSGIREHPLLGVGEGNITQPLDRHFDPRMLEGWVDSSHNIFLDVVLAHGIVGVAAYLLFLGTIARGYIRLRRSDPALAGFGIAACMGYGIQGMFIFDTLVALLPLIVVAGYAAIRSVGDSDEKVRSPIRAEKIITALLVCGVVMLSLSYIRGIRALSTLSDAHRIVRRNGELSQAISKFETARTLMLFGQVDMAHVARDAVFFVLNHVSSYTKEDIASLVEEFTRISEAAVQAQGETSDLLGDRANVYLNLAADFPTYRDRILPLLDQAIRLSPNRHDLSVMRAQALIRVDERLSP